MTHGFPVRAAHQWSRGLGCNLVNSQNAPRVQLTPLPGHRCSKLILLAEALGLQPRGYPELFPPGFPAGHQRNTKVSPWFPESLQLLSAQP